jgi:small neutral amino acid transporter SnatA (MarC family)
LVGERSLRILAKIFGIFFYFIAGLGVFAQVLAAFNGTNESFRMLFQLILNPSIAMEFPTPALVVLGEVLVQFFILWIFYFIGKKLMAYSAIKDAPLVHKINDRIEPRL